MGQFDMAILSNEVKNFLKNYAPKNRHFTSEEEIELIKEKIGLAHYITTNDFNLLRNAVVYFYSKMMDNDMEHRWEISNSMMSVTAVIDHHMYAVVY